MSRPSLPPRYDHKKILAMLNRKPKSVTVGEIAQEVAPGLSRQAMDQYIRKYFEVSVRWRAKK